MGAEGEVPVEGLGATQPTGRRKVLYAASSFGHLASFHIPYIEALRGDGFDVTLLAGGDPARVHLPQGARCVPVEFVKSMSAPANFKTAAAIASLQAHERFDVVLTHTSLAAFFVRLGLMGAALHAHAARPYVVNTVHGYLFDGASSAPRRAALLAAERICAPVTSRIVVMNRQDAAIARAHKLCRGDVVETPGMGVVLDGLSPATPRSKSEARARLHLPEDAFVCLCVAEFSARKNQRTLIEALQSLPEHVLLALPGTGALLEECRGLAVSAGFGSRVLFPGFLARDELAVWRRASDVCVSASRYEGLPFHVVEAFACGLPGVLSAVKGHEDLVEPGQTGLLYPFGDADAFAACIRRLLDNPSELAHMGVCACKAAQRYALPAVMPGLLRIYEE